MSREKTLDPDFLASRLREYAALLQVGQFPDTAQILKYFASTIEAQAANDKFYQENYPKLEAALQREFAQGVRWRPRLLDDADAIIKGAPVALDTLRILERTKLQQENLNRILATAIKETDEVAQIYLLCFIYLLLVEGIYDEVMRFLFALHGKLLTTEADLPSVRTEFIKDGVAGTLFDGLNSTVRNGIAHATFSIDIVAKQIMFEDRRSNNREPMSFDQFRDLCQKVFDVGTAVQVLLILRVLVPLNYVEALKRQTS
jgi:hypothetical protein